MSNSKKTDSLLNQILENAGWLRIDDVPVNFSYFTSDSSNQLLEITWDEDFEDYSISFNENSFDTADVNAENGVITMSDTEGNLQTFRLFVAIPKKILVDWD